MTDGLSRWRHRVFSPENMDVDGGNYSIEAEMRDIFATETTILNYSLSVSFNTIMLLRFILAVNWCSWSIPLGQESLTHQAKMTLF